MLPARAQTTHEKCRGDLLLVWLPLHTQGASSEPPRMVQTMIGPCHDCPFRREGFLRISPEDAAALLDFTQGSCNITVCHNSKPQRDQGCGGAIDFLAGDNPAVFATEEEMVTAHAESTKPIQGHLWGINDDV